MKRRIASALAFFTISSLIVFAASPEYTAPNPDAAKVSTYERMIPAAIQQRDQAMSRALNLELQLVVLQGECDALRAEVARLKAPAPAPAPAKEAAPEAGPEKPAKP